MKFAILFVIVAVALAAIVGIGIVKNQPETVALDSMVGVADDLLAREEVSPIVNMLKSGSLYLALSTAEDENGESVIGNLGAYGKVYFSEDAMALENIDFLYNDFWIYGDAYVSDDIVVIEESKVLGGAYGSKRNTLAMSFENSIFAYNSESKYAVQDTRTHNTIVNALLALEDTSFDEDTEALLTKIVPEMWKIVYDNCEITTGNAELSLQGNRESVRVIRMIFDAEALSRIVEQLYDYVEVSHDIPFFIRKHDAALALCFGLRDGQTAYTAYMDYLEAFEDKLDDICENIQRSVNGEVEIKIATPMLQSKLLKLELKYNSDTLFLLDFGKDGLRTTNEITVQLQDQTFQYSIDQNDDDAYKSRFYINESEKISINVDKSREKFDIKFDAIGNARNITAKGVYKESTNWASVQLTKITYSPSMYESERVIKCDIMAILQQNDTLPTFSASYSKFSSITEDEVDAWLEKIGS